MSLCRRRVRLREGGCWARSLEVLKTERTDHRGRVPNHHHRGEPLPFFADSRRTTYRQCETSPKVNAAGPAAARRWHLMVNGRVRRY